MCCVANESYSFIMLALSTMNPHVDIILARTGSILLPNKRQHKMSYGMTTKGEKDPFDQRKISWSLTWPHEYFTLLDILSKRNDRMTDILDAESSYFEISIRLKIFSNIVAMVEFIHNFRHQKCA